MECHVHIAITTVTGAPSFFLRTIVTGDSKDVRERWERKLWCVEIALVVAITKKN